MKTVVITGISHGLANAFLGLGCAATVSGRTAADVDQAVAGLAQKHEPDRILGHACDVTDAGQVRTLWDAAHLHRGQIDMGEADSAADGAPTNPQADQVVHPV